MKKFLSIFFCCVFCLATIVVPCVLLGGVFGNDDQKTSAAAITYWSDNYALSYAGGTGTSIDPYLISTPEQLALLAHQINHDSNTEKCFKLTNNIDLAGHDWVPIGIGATDVWKRFRGSFDGNNKVIFNMTITLSKSYYSKLESVVASPAGPECPVEPSVGAPDPEEPDRWGCHISVGLFGLTKGAIIENLILSDPKIYDTDSVYVELDPDYPLGFCCEVGNVVGWADSSDLSNVGTVCSNTFGIHLSVSSPSDSSVGGICGRADDSDFSGCFNYADVSGASDSGEKAGGIVGAAYDTNFTDCYNAAPITGGYAVGGIIGDYGDRFYSKMMWRCYNIGAIRSNDRGGYAGGLIGYLNLSSSLFRVYACFNDSTVESMIEEYGALVGVSRDFDSMRYAFERGSNDKGTNAYNESKAWNSLSSFTDMLPASVEVNTKSYTNTSTIRPNTGSVEFYNTTLGDPSVTGWDVSNSTSSRWFLDTPTLDGTTESPTKLNGQFPILSWAYTTYYLHYNQSLCGASFGFSVESHLDGTSEYNAFKDIAGVNMRRRRLPAILGTKLDVGISVSSPSATKWSGIYYQNGNDYVQVVGGSTVSVDDAFNEEFLPMADGVNEYIVWVNPPEKTQTYQFNVVVSDDPKAGAAYYVPADKNEAGYVTVSYYTNSEITTPKTTVSSHVVTANANYGRNVTATLTITNGAYEIADWWTSTTAFSGTLVGGSSSDIPADAMEYDFVPNTTGTLYVYIVLKPKAVTLNFAGVYVASSSTSTAYSRTSTQAASVKYAAATYDAIKNNKKDATAFNTSSNQALSAAGADATFTATEMSNYAFKGWYTNTTDSFSGATCATTGKTYTVNPTNLEGRYVFAAYYRTVTLYQNYVSLYAYDEVTGEYVDSPDIATVTVNYFGEDADRITMQLVPNQNYDMKNDKYFTVEDVVINQPGYYFAGIYWYGSEYEPDKQTIPNTELFIDGEGDIVLYFIKPANPLKYDAVEKYWYFENGFLPQDFDATTHAEVEQEFTGPKAVTETGKSYKMNCYYDTEEKLPIYHSQAKNADFVRVLAQQAATVTLDDGSVQTFEKGKYYWFKVEPVRWRVTDYGEEDLPENWYWYASVSDYTAVTDKIVWAGKMLENHKVVENWSITAAPLFNEVAKELGAGGANSMELTKDVLYEGYEVDSYGPAGQQNKVVSEGYYAADTLATRIASVQEISASFKDMSAKMTDFVAFCIATNNGYAGTPVSANKTSTYATRSLGVGLGGVLNVNNAGHTGTQWLDIYSGVRLSCRFSGVCRVFDKTNTAL